MRFTIAQPRQPCRRFLRSGIRTLQHRRRQERLEREAEQGAGTIVLEEQCAPPPRTLGRRVRVPSSVVLDGKFPGVP